jgi:hypothetical protein
MSDLDDLLNNFDQRKRQEIDTAEQARREAEKLRTISLNALREKILPTLKELAATISAKGHDAAVGESFDNNVYPSITFAFTPTIPNPPAYTPASTIKFAHTQAGTIEMSQTISGKSRTETRPSATISPSNIADDLVRSQVLAFIGAVLKAN